MWLSTLKQWLIRVFADVSLWESQMSTHIIAISDFSDTLIILSLEAKDMLLKKYVFFKIVSITLELIDVLVFSIR